MRVFNDVFLFPIFLYGMLFSINRSTGDDGAHHGVEQTQESKAEAGAKW